MYDVSSSGSARAAPAQSSAGHLAFMALFGLAGWAALLAASYLPELEPALARSEGVLPFAVFFVVIVVARSMAVRVLPDTVISLDTGFYIAAAICLGSVTAGRLVALALTLDSLFRLAGGSSQRQRGQSWTSDLTYVIYFGGMTGALLMGTAWLFGVDAFASTEARGDRELVVLQLVFGLGASFLAIHYAIQGARLRALGQPLRVFARRMALPSVLAEVALFPLSVVVVLIYSPDQPLGFILLGATYVLITFVFNRLSRTGAALAKRVGELETLNATSQALARSLQQHDVVQTIARETIRAIPEAELLTLVSRDPRKPGAVIVDCFDRERRRFERFHAAEDQGPSGWVLAHRQSLLVPELRATRFGEAANADAGVRSWMGVPLTIHGETAAVLAVQSRERAAFGADQLRVLEAVGAQTAIALENAHLYELAMVDGLTGLFVRRYFDARLDEEIQRSHRFGTEFSVVMMDLDDFKRLNDTHGHPAGDAVLRAIADAVKRQMRGVDTAARYGGEEIAIILPRTALLDAYNLAERIRAAIEDLPIASGGGETLRITASFGIAAYPESGKGSAADVVRRADTALYRAKKTGKNRVELYWAEGTDRSHIRSV